MFILEEKFNIKEFPRLPCPTCREGKLVIVKETILHKHPSFIKKLPNDSSEASEYYDENSGFHIPVTYWDIEGTEHEIFISSFYLECDREFCQEIVISCGESKLDGYYEQDKDGEVDFIESFYYFPKFFHPTIRLFNYPINTPENVKNELQKAFSLFWSNPSACTNSLRKAVERILDHKEGFSNKRLHERIENMSSVNSELKEYLMATKWIGNDGSHDEIELEHYDAILAFKFIEQCLVELFDNKGTDLNSIARKINENKKSISKIKN